MTTARIFIGSRHHPERFDEAEREFGPGERPVLNDPTNDLKGRWGHRIDAADEVVVVLLPDGSLGAGTVDELFHAMRQCRRRILLSRPQTVVNAAP